MFPWLALGPQVDPAVVTLSLSLFEVEYCLQTLQVKENLAYLSRDLACISSISMIPFISFIHSMMEGEEDDLQCLEINCLPALKQNLRREFFWNLVAPGKMERRAINGEGASGLP